MTDEDYLTAVLNCDDQSGMATDAAWRAVSALRARAERAEAEIERVRELHRPSQSTIWSHDLQQAITVTTCQHCGSDPYPCPTVKALDGTA